jgi:molybdopterin/thiamine biosynthesis adenylyltransferase
MVPGPFQADFTKLEHTAFSRNRVGALTTVVVGAGALGNEVSRLLGLVGVAEVTVVDPDRVESGNLPRSIFYWHGDAIGHNKATALTGEASTLFPHTRWTALPVEIADVGFRTLAGVDIVFSCVDSDLARLEIAYVTKQLRIPVADGGLGGLEHALGRATYFPGSPGTACYGCLLGPRRRRELLETWQSTVRSCTGGLQVDSSDGATTTPTMAAVVGAAQVESGLRTLVESREGAEVFSRTIEIQLHPERRLTEFTTGVSVACPFHAAEPESRHPMPEGSTFGDLLDKSAAAAVLLDWPICLHARCLVCGEVWCPRQRLATLRRRGFCPACGSTAVLELDTLRSIGRESPWASVTPEALGLPGDHLFRVRGLV